MKYILQWKFKLCIMGKTETKKSKQKKSKQKKIKKLSREDLAKLMKASAIAFGSLDTIGL